MKINDAKKKFPESFQLSVKDFVIVPDFNLDNVPSEKKLKLFNSKSTLAYPFYKPFCKIFKDDSAN